MCTEKAPRPKRPPRRRLPEWRLAQSAQIALLVLSILGAVVSIAALATLSLTASAHDFWATGGKSVGVVAVLNVCFFELRRLTRPAPPTTRVSARAAPPSNGHPSNKANKSSKSAK